MALIPGTLPNDTCYGTPQDLLELFAQYLDTPAFSLNTYITNLATATTPGPSDYLIINQSSVSKKITYANLVPPANSAFFFYKSADQTVTTATTTKCTFDSTLFNQNSIITLASSTFTPTVAGYYKIEAQIHAYEGGSGSTNSIAIYKNGSATNGIHGATQVNGATASATTMVPVSGVMYFNGSSDTFEIYGKTTATTWSKNSGTATGAIANVTYATYVNGFYLGA
jgi:hypothetical protein